MLQINLNMCRAVLCGRSKIPSPAVSSVLLIDGSSHNKCGFQPTACNYPMPEPINFCSLQWRIIKDEQIIPCSNGFGALL